MKTVQELPQDYSLLETVDLQNDKKTALKVNIFSLVLAVILAFIGNMFVPMGVFFAIEESILAYLLKCGGLLVAFFVYIILHEITHGIAMKAFGAKEVKFGFTGIYAFAGSKKDYLGKKQYLCVAMAPLVIWGIIFGVISAFVPAEWFWFVFFLQIGNISGAAGDIYVTWRFSRLRSDAYFFDTGVKMEVYTPDGMY